MLTLLANWSTLVVVAMVLAAATFAAMVMLSGGVAGGESIVGNSIATTEHVHCVYISLVIAVRVFAHGFNESVAGACVRVSKPFSLCAAYAVCVFVC